MRVRVLVVTSGGGHWVQMRRLRSAFEGCDVAYVTTHPDYAVDVPGERFYSVPDMTRRNIGKLMRLVPSLVAILLKERPDVVVTTGAAPGLVCLALARIFTRASTVWIDSIANCERISSSGKAGAMVCHLVADPVARTRRRWRALLLGRRAVIFVTIGSMFPFDRLIRVVDELAPSWPEETFFAQTGDGTYRPRNMEFVRSLPSTAFAEKIKASRLIVAHAGMGSVISALEAGRPIAVLPRDVNLGEHTTDHQMATARWLSTKPGIHVAFDDHSLKRAIEDAMTVDTSSAPSTRSAPPEFLSKLRQFVQASRQFQASEVIVDDCWSDHARRQSIMMALLG